MNLTLRNGHIMAILISVVLIIFLGIFDNGFLMLKGLDGFDIVLNKSHYLKSSWNGYDPMENAEIAVIGFFYKWISIGISLLGLVFVLIRRNGLKWLSITLFLFALTSFLLSLPVYHGYNIWHDSHGHSFWYGGHFH